MLQKDNLLEWRTIYKNVLLGLKIQKNITAENKKYVECKELHVFDWEGNLLKKVVLTVPVGNIHLDLANNIIYSLNPVNDRIYLYHISDMNLP